MIVDLPEPVEPTRKTNSPGWMAKVASSSPMSPLAYFLETERKSMTAPGTGSPTTRWRGAAGSVRRRMWRSVAAMGRPQGYSPPVLAPLPATGIAKGHRPFAADGESWQVAPSTLLHHGQDPLLHPAQRASAVPG